MEKLCIIGAGSTIAKKFINKINDFDEIIKVGRSNNNDLVVNIDYKNYDEQIKLIPTNCEKYLITLGILLPKKINQQCNEETLNSIAINLLAPVKLIERIFEVNKKARIIVLGSESGSKGSYDTTYFLTKAALASYVSEKHITHTKQQLVMISPSTILDSKMTQSRNDLEEVKRREKFLPKGRYLYAEEIAELIYYLLYVDKGYISNEIININGGKFARMK